jgi:hypothetical protein
LSARVGGRRCPPCARVAPAPRARSEGDIVERVRLGAAYEGRGSIRACPAEATGRWRGEPSEAISLALRAHTHALVALKVQHQVSNGVAQLAAAGSSLDPGNSCHLRDAQLDDQRPRENALLRSWH